ncbi:MAG: type II secretion protein F [Dethiosulfovibrio peptidovorans]|nr:MAG: type II secretion protein F [Dethiosulfovibrio peptidovorans]
MPAYRYSAYDPKGALKKGRIDAPGSQQAAEALAVQGLVVVEMAEEEVSVGKKYSKLLSLEDHENFCRSLSTYLRAGLPLIEVLRLLEKQGGKHLGLLYGSLRQAVEGGRRLSAALRETRCFDENLCCMLESGERGGTLDQVLKQAVGLFSMQASLRRRLQNAMTYPIIMMVVGLGVVAFLMAYVVPKVAVLFSDMGQALPLPTRILMAVSRGVRFLGVPALLSILVLFVLVKTGRIHLRLPFFQGIRENLILSLVVSNQASLLRSGIPLVQALRMSAVLDPQKDRWLSVADQIKGGLRFEKALEKDGSFDEDLVYFIRVGEVGGDLPGSLEHVAEVRWDRAKSSMDRMTHLIEPAMVLFLGAVVGFVVVAILLPIFDISSFVR